MLGDWAENNRKSSPLVGKCKALEPSGQSLNPISILTRKTIDNNKRDNHDSIQ